MTSAKTNGLVTDIAGLRERAGTHLGYTDWQEMTQERVNQFADATDDHQLSTSTSNAPSRRRSAARSRTASSRSRWWRRSASG